LDSQMIVDILTAMFLALGIGAAGIMLISSILYIILFLSKWFDVVMDFMDKKLEEDKDA